MKWFEKRKTKKDEADEHLAEDPYGFNNTEYVDETPEERKEIEKHQRLIKERKKEERPSVKFTWKSKGVIFMTFTDRVLLRFLLPCILMYFLVPFAIGTSLTIINTLCIMTLLTMFKLWWK